ncbi:hypothetical protein ACH9D2_11305 [Kocuria sp. M4R2S49]|uniref:hypothetical protein n=1 Tax=Kocuria rhizosphaericola TaxID=3376284 RepID=UPI00379D3B3B
MALDLCAGISAGDYERALAIFVGDADELESWVARIADRGLETAEWEDCPAGMREALFRDPEGSEIRFGGAPAG